MNKHTQANSRNPYSHYKMRIAYVPSYIKCPTGVYQLVGTVPEYLGWLLYANEQIAQQALAEAHSVLASGDAPAQSIFIDAYRANKRIVSA